MPGAAALTLENARLTEEVARLREALRAAETGRDAAEALMSGLMRHAPVAMAMLDCEMRVLVASPTWLAALNVTHSEVVGRHLYDVAPRAAAHAERHQRCLAGEVLSDEDLLLADKDGVQRYGRLEMAPWRDARGRIGGMMVAIYDTSTMVHARQAARRSEQRLTLALEIFESVVWEMSFKDRRLFATGAVSAIFDQPPSYKSFANDILAAVHPLDRDRVAKVWNDHIQHGRPFRTEHRIKRADGLDVWVDAAAETLRDANGAPERVIGVLKNITDRKHDQLAIAHAREVAEAANKAKSEFLANMSHEIRTPLNGVLGVAGALARTELSSQQGQMVRLIETSAETLERLLSDILDLARIEAGRFEIKSEPFDLPDLLGGVAALFEPRAREQGVGFVLDVSPGCQGRFAGDEVRLRQILSNLLSNAVKFTSAGVVRLSAAAEPLGGDRVRLTFTVKDTGIGFDAATAARLFERFEQADGSITRRYGGYGPGPGDLQVPGRAHGRIDVGAVRARPRIPLHPGAGAAALAPEVVAEVKRSSVQMTSGASLRVLLAEDHPTNRKVVQLILGAAGIDLVSVENGAEAVEATAREAFDLILMDMQMPVMDGLTATRAIRARERATGVARTPILSLTANAMPEHASASRQAGADGHITKPIAAQALLDAVYGAVAESRADPAHDAIVA